MNKPLRVCELIKCLLSGPQTMFSTSCGAKYNNLAQGTNFPENDYERMSDVRPTSTCSLQTGAPSPLHSSVCQAQPAVASRPNCSRGPRHILRPLGVAPAAGWVWLALMYSDTRGLSRLAKREVLLVSRASMSGSAPLAINVSTMFKNSGV